MPTGRTFLTAPLSMARNRTSASAATPTISVGAASKSLTCCCVRECLNRRSAKRGPPRKNICSSQYSAIVILPKK